MSKKSNNFWAAIEAKIETGERPAVFINPAGRVCLDNGWNGAEFPARLLAKLPADVLEAAHAKTAERAAEEAAAAAARRDARQAHEARVESLRHRRCWVLGGLYLEDQTVSRYTLQELLDWRGWVSGVFRYRRPTVTVTALADDGGVIVADDWSAWFHETCGEPCPATENMAELAADLSRYTNERRGVRAQLN